MRNAAGELDHFETALDVALGIGKGLAVLGREQPRQIVIFALDQLQELEHDAGAALRIGGGPGRERGFGIGDRVFDLGFIGERHLGLHLAGIGIEHVALPPRSALHLLAADEVADVTHVWSPWKTNGASAAWLWTYCAGFFRDGHGGRLANQRPHRLDRHQHDALAKRRKREAMAFIKADSGFVDGMGHNAPDSGDLGCRQASPQRVRQQSRSQTSAAPLRVDCKAANQ